MSSPKLSGTGQTSTIVPHSMQHATTVRQTQHCPSQHPCPIKKQQTLPPQLSLTPQALPAQSGVPQTPFRLPLGMQQCDELHCPFLVHLAPLGFDAADTVLNVSMRAVLRMPPSSRRREPVVPSSLTIASNWCPSMEGASCNAR